MARSTAWLLELGGGLRVAVGELELVHVLPAPQNAYLVGGAPAYCRHVLLWENEVVPILDLASWLGVERDAKRSYCAIVRYRTGGGRELGFGSVLTGAVPKRIDVDDEQACDPPQEGTAAWRAVAIGCFEQEGRRVPILDLPHVFSDALLDQFTA